MRFPKGIRKIIEQYHDRIQAVSGGWVDFENPLGCASFGCVFRIWTHDVAEDEPGHQALITDRVLKISTDPSEGPVIAAIMKTGEDKFQDGLVRWYGVWKIPEKIQEGPRGTAWVIVREEVRPFDWMRDMKFSMFSRGHDFIDDLRDYNASARKAIDLKTPWKKDRAKEDAWRAMGKLYNHEETYYVAQAIEELSRQGITLADVHHGNLGFRLHETEEQPIHQALWSDRVERPALLIFDPGHSEAPPTEIPDLW